MQEQKEKKRKTIKEIISHIVHSISFRIVLILSIVMGIIFVDIFLRQKQEIYNTASEYFSRIGAMASQILSETVADNSSEIQQNFDDELLEQLQNLCIEYEINDIFVAESEPPYTTANEIVYVSPVKKIVRDGKDEDSSYIRELNKDEQKVFAGIEQSIYSHFNVNDNLYSTYLSGLYDINGNCYVVVGVDFLVNDIQRIIYQQVSRLTYFLVIPIILCYLIIIVCLHFLVVKPIQKINSKLEDFVTGDRLNPEHLPIKGKNELSRMAVSYNAMVDDVTNYFQTIKGILAAAEIQKGLLPEEHFEYQTICVDASLTPARYIGGDLYDYYLLDDEHLCLVIADVSGKGMSAAMFMANVVNAIKYNARMYSTPSEILSATNNDLCARNPEHLFVTAFVAIYDCRHQRLTFSNGGHNRPYLVRDQKAQELRQAGGLLLGLFPDETYEDHTIQIMPGDALFMYTDGLNEAVSADKTFFGEERICQCLETVDRHELTDINRMMKDAIDAFVGDVEPHDDTTMLSVVFGTEQKLQIGAFIEELGKVKQFILHNPWIPEKEGRKIYLAAEELLVNIIHYGFMDTHPENRYIRLSLTPAQNEIELTIRDNGLPYNPLDEIIQKEDYDPDAQYGGLGKLIAFSIMKAEYQYKDGNNTLILKKEYAHDNSKRSE